MSLYVLDTDVLTLLQEGDPTVRQHVDSHPKQDIAITIISVEEQLTGWYTKIRRSQALAILAQAY
jgi:tRNA(fMet)-specific endonuclease VapC